MPDLQWLNQLPTETARAEFLRCCGSTRWAEQMASARPFTDELALHTAAAAAEESLTRDDWLEAFAAHPKIGDMTSLRIKFAHTADWSASEQGEVNAAAEATLLALADGNRMYEVRFGYIFIVCATGKTADEMLALLQKRLFNDPSEELAIAAGEQRKITRLRLQRLCS